MKGRDCLTLGSSVSVTLSRAIHYRCSTSENLTTVLKSDENAKCRHVRCSYATMLTYV